ncbi:hypothetical protein P245_25795 [Comamonas thiooxydans]|uniref:Uncharacterized protein n=1 Tax=Comamonas thiooxydans TaxID=363952 RepID=A0A0E3B775_9BURK|nr:hypothetical protein P245_25795 [Comamonas thiooxydans]
MSLLGHDYIWLNSGYRSIDCLRQQQIGIKISAHHVVSGPDDDTLGIFKNQLVLDAAIQIHHCLAAAIQDDRIGIRRASAVAVSHRWRGCPSLVGAQLPPNERAAGGIVGVENRIDKARGHWSSKRKARQG